MKIHYFQRYHGKENVATANTLLLLSRLYAYSPDKFFRFLKASVFSDNIEPEIVFQLQEKSDESVPDATITQAGFKIVVETKLHGQFSVDQLKRHLTAFSGEKYQVLMTLDPQPMNQKTAEAFAACLMEYHRRAERPISHINTTFEKMISDIREVLDDRDYEMLEVVSDYEEYCYDSDLISGAWKRMRVQLAGVTLEVNKRLNLYYDDAGRGFSGHEYLGLYKDKCVRAVGKISAIVTAKGTPESLAYGMEKGTLTDEMKSRIHEAIEDGKRYGYQMDNTRYFFVDRFFETDFRKITPRAPMGSRIFDLTKVLGVSKLPGTAEIAERLRERTWE
ncbi:hypothetical protein [Dysosmobacter sp.]